MLLNHPSSCSLTPRTPVGGLLWGTTISGSWSLVCSDFSINHRELLAVLFAVRGFPPSLQGLHVVLYANTTAALAYLKKQRGIHSQTLNSVAQVILRLCESRHIHLLPQFVPSKLNDLADSLSRKSQVLGSEWTLCSEAFQQLLRRWPATIDLFSTVLNHRLLVYFSPMLDPQSAGTDAMLQSWDGLQAYAFPPFGLILCVVAKVQQSRGLELTLVAPFWTQHPWFLDLLVEIPFFLPQRRDLLKQPHFHHYHQNLPVLQLTAFRLSSDPHVISGSLKKSQLAHCRRRSTRINYQAKWTVYRSWCHHHGHSVCRPTVSKVADFLLYFRHSLSLSYSSITSYRSM